MDSGSPTPGATLEIPPGNYFLDGDLHIERECVVRGWSVGGGIGLTQLVFAAPYGLVVDRFNTGLTEGAGDFSVIEYLDITSTPLELEARPVSAAVTVGTKVYGVDDNRYYFECTVAGTTDAANPFPTNETLAIGSTVLDGTATWTVCTHAGITMKGRAYLRKIFLYGFTNAGILVAAAYGSEDPPASANYWQLAHIWIAYCGMGICVYGGDSNVGTATDLTVDTCGGGIPGTGGHGIWDMSYLGCTWIGCGSQGCTGNSIWTTVGLTCSVFLGCYTEADTSPPLVTQPAILIGGAHGSGFNYASTGLVLSPGSSFNVEMRRQSQQIQGGLDIGEAPIVHWFVHEGDDQALHSYHYELARTGEWSFAHGARALLGFMGQTSGLLGTWRDPHGHFLGVAADQVYIGPASARTDKYVRGGELLVGDQFWLQGTGRAGTYSGWTVRQAGFRGKPWQASTAYSPAGMSVVADMVEPTAHDPNEPVAGGNVFRCILEGESDATEPNWALAPNVDDEIADNTTRWKNVGKVALFNRIGGIAEEGKLTTTDGTANQVLASYPLEDDTLTYVAVTVVARRTDAADGASFALSGSWYRYGAGSPIAVRAPTQDQKDGNSAWDAELVVNGDTVEVQVTGETAKTISWTAIRKGMEGA